MSSGEGDVDPGAWIKIVGEQMRADVEALKRMFWGAAGACFGIGIMLGVFLPPILKKIGFG